MSEEQLLEHAVKIQKEIHSQVEEILDNTKASYQDAVNVALMKKIAELELKIENLENNNINN